MLGHAGIVSATGTILAHTRHMPRAGATYVRSVTDGVDPEYIVGREVGHATAALGRRHGFVKAV